MSGQILGLPLTSYTEVITKVDPAHTAKPDREIDIYAKLKTHEKKIRHWYCYNEQDKLSFKEVFDWDKMKSSLNKEYFSEFNFDELAKVWYSSSVMLRISEIFRASCDGSPAPSHWLVGKIVSSMWRWGCDHEQWNDVVDFYDAIRRFDFGLPDFDVVLDHTTWCNDRGWSEYSRTYLDGALAYLIRYKGEHVLTLGFSVSGRKRVLVSQCQLKRKKGNRWLYKLPSNHLDYALARLAAAFPYSDQFGLYLTDGVSIAKRTATNYTHEEERPGKEILMRIAKFYSQNLGNYIRRGRTNVNGQLFHRLISRQEV